MATEATLKNQGDPGSYHKAQSKGMKMGLEEGLSVGQLCEILFSTESPFHK